MIALHRLGEAEVGVDKGAAQASWRRLVFSTRNAEEARNYVRAQEFLVDFPPREAAQVDMRINGAFLPSMYLGYLQFGAAAEIRTNPSLDLYRFAMPLSGTLEAAFCGDGASCGPGRGVLMSPTRIRLVRAERDLAGLNIFLQASALRRHLSALLGEPPKSDLEFAAIVDLGQGYGQSLQHYALSAMTDLEQEAPLLNPITASLFEQFVMVGMLLAHPHNYSEKLNRGPCSVGPRDVKRAIEYIEANLDEPIGFTDIAAASGIPGRTLSQHFRRFRATTPMRYLRDARLDKVHETLRKAEPEESIMSIAGNWGFSHMGRFAAVYRERFGESPSETLGNVAKPGASPYRTAPVLLTKPK
jgi:AraC-like DNA-binding protein